MNEKEKIASIQKMAEKLLGDNTNCLIVTFNDGRCGVSMHGDTSSIAQSIFAIMHSDDNQLGFDIYKIIKKNG